MSDTKLVGKIIGEAELSQLSPLGRILEENRNPTKKAAWRKVFFVSLSLVVALSLLVPNLHPHFVVDKYPGFWPVFALVVGVSMIFLVKKIVQPLIKRPEDYYGDI